MQVLKILARIYVHDLDQAVEFYEELLKTKASLRFTMPAIGLELAQVSDLLIIIFP